MVLEYGEKAQVWVELGDARCVNVRRKIIIPEPEI